MICHNVHTVIVMVIWFAGPGNIVKSVARRAIL